MTTTKQNHSTGETIQSDKRSTTTGNHPIDHMKKLTVSQAKAKGYVPMTQPYNLNSPRELEWYHKVLWDMRTADAVIVEFSTGNEVWRHKRELNPISSKEYLSWKRNMK